MDFYKILWTIIGGGLGGVFGAIIGSRFSEKVWGRIAILICVVAFGFVVPQIAQRIFSFPTLKQSLHQAELTLEANPGFRKAIAGMTAEQVLAFTQRSAQLGLKRLDGQSLKHWNRLRLRMATVDPHICAGFWTGRGVNTQTINAALIKMTPQEAKAWTDIGIRAAILEINQTAFHPISNEAMQIGIREVSKKLSKREVQRIQLTMMAAGRAKDSEACWVMRSLLSGAENLPPAQAEPFLRALAAI